jgi:phage terminase large subunit-like protein
MRIKKLREIAEECRHNPNYQYRDMTDEELEAKSLASFTKLTAAQQAKVQKSWLTHLEKKDTDELTNPKIGKELLKYRFMCQTNLFMLCHVLETYNQTTVATHEEICNKFFAAKDPTYSSFEKFANQYTDLKERMLLVPRGGFKSSCNIADCVQWIACFPAVTILILTGVYKLASDFVGELRGHFTLEDTDVLNTKTGNPVQGPKQFFDEDTDEWSDSMFQVLFPEHCIPNGTGTQFEFESPAGGHDKEPTVRAASIEQALAGMHFGVLKLDDVVTNENSQTVDRLVKVNKQISINKALLNPYGFFDVIGTWYDECLVAGTPITMGDWSQKNIEDIKVGDVVVGFTEEGNKRSMLVPTKVIHVFEPQARKVNKYTFASGRSVVSTESHLWWKGSHGSGDRYKKIGLGYHNQSFVRRLLTPTVKNQSREAGYLSGLYDGEGSFQENPGHPSGMITICQTQHNPEVVDSMRESLNQCGFDHSEFVYENINNKHEFKIRGGWKSRYKFLAEIQPIRSTRITASLFGQNVTEKDQLVSIEPFGEELTYCFETETHNYIADGCCSHNCDYYGLKIKQQEAFAKDEGLLDCIKGTVDSGRFEISVDTKIYLRSALWLTPEAVEAGKTDIDAQGPDYKLWFPERLDFKFLSTERKTDPEGFAIKYLNNPRKIHRIKFDRALLLKRTIPHNQLPPQGVVVTTIDTAYSTKSWADYTVILTTLIYGGRFYIINMVRGRFSEYELPAVIAGAANKWKPKRIAIEDSVGVKWMGRELRREMDKLQISVPVEYVSLGLGSKSKSKQLKAKPVLRLLGDDRMYFLNSCEGLAEMYNELEAFTGTSADAHDDIVSALSLLVEQFSSYADMGARVSPVDSQYISDKQNFERHQLIHGLGKYSKYNANQNDDNPVTQWQVDNQPATDVSDTYRDPFADLIG